MEERILVMDAGNICTRKRSCEGGHGGHKVRKYCLFGVSGVEREWRREEMEFCQQSQEEDHALGKR